MNASHDFLIIFSPNEQRGGGGGGASFFPCSADHEQHKPPCKVAFFGLATNVLNMRNNNNNNNNLIDEGSDKNKISTQKVHEYSYEEVSFCEKVESNILSLTIDERMALRVCNTER